MNFGDYRSTLRFDIGGVSLSAPENDDRSARDTHNIKIKAISRL